MSAVSAAETRSRGDAAILGSHPLHLLASALEEPPPADVEAERAVLGSLLLAGAAEDVAQRVGILEPDDFSMSENRVIFATIRKLVEIGVPVDLLTVKDALGRGGELRAAGGSSHIAGLLDPTPNVASLERYAEIVMRKSIARQLIRAHSAAAVRAVRGAPASKIATELQPIVDACLKRESASNRESDGRSLTSLSDFLAEEAPVVDWLIDGLFLRGGVVLLAAKPKAGKSTISRDAAFAVATGTPFLGRKVQRGRVLFVALEEHRDRLREQFLRMGFGGDEDIFIHTGSAPADGVAWLRGLVLQHKPSFVVVDPVLKLVRVTDANAYAETSAALEPISAIARDSGACLLLVHHANKMSSDGGDSILGSTAIFGVADTVLLLKRRDDQVRTMASIQRYGNDMPETVLDMDVDTGLLAIAGEYADLKIESVIARIQGSLTGGKQMTEAEIREAVGGDRTVVTKAIRQAVEMRTVRRIGQGKKGNPFRYFTEGAVLAS